MEFAFLLTIEMQENKKNSQVKQRKIKIEREQILRLSWKKKTEKHSTTYITELTTFITLKELACKLVWQQFMIDTFW